MNKTKCYAIKVKLKNGVIISGGIALTKEVAEQRKKDLELQGYQVLPIRKENLYE